MSTNPEPPRRPLSWGVVITLVAMAFAATVAWFVWRSVASALVPH